MLTNQQFKEGMKIPYWFWIGSGSLGGWGGLGLEDQNVPKTTIRTTTRTLPFTRSNDNKNTFYSSCSDSLYFRDFRPYKMFSRNVAARLRSPHETERRSVLFIPWAKLVDGQYENCLLTKFGAAVQINLERTMGAGLRFTSLIIRRL